MCVLFFYFPNVHQRSFLVGQRLEDVEQTALAVKGRRAEVVEQMRRAFAASDYAPYGYWRSTSGR